MGFFHLRTLNSLTGRCSAYEQQVNMLISSCCPELSPWDTMQCLSPALATKMLMWITSLSLPFSTIHFFTHFVSREHFLFHRWEEKPQDKTSRDICKFHVLTLRDPESDLWAVGIKWQFICTVWKTNLPLAKVSARSTLTVSHSSAI